MTAIITCVDPRVTERVEETLGLVPGTAYTIRTAGASFAPDGEVMRSLRIVVRHLGVDRVCVVGHTDCRAAELFGRPEQGIVEEGLRVIRADLHLPGTLKVEGYVLDLVTGALTYVRQPISSRGGTPR